MNNIVENAFNPILFLKILEGENFDNCIGTINYGNELEFNYINFQNINLFKSHITLQQIFKFNMFLIISKLSEHFKNTNIKLTFDNASRNELILKDIDTTIKHDIYISFNQEDKYFECGFDFVKKKKHFDEYKYVSSMVNLDYYKYFDEDVDKINTFIEDIIYRLLTILCSLNNDEFKLAEILFIKSNRNLLDSIEHVEIYKQIITGKKNKFVNFYEMYEKLSPINPETGKDLDYNEFIIYIQDKILDGRKMNITNNNILLWEDFEWIILNLDKNIGFIIEHYKNIYIQSINTVILALKTIIELTQQINKTKKNIPQYVNQLLSKDIINLADKELLENIKDQLNEYFSK